MIMDKNAVEKDHWLEKRRHFIGGKMLLKDAEALNGWQDWKAQAADRYSWRIGRVTAWSWQTKNLKQLQTFLIYMCLKLFTWAKLHLLTIIYNLRCIRYNMYFVVVTIVLCYWLPIGTKYIILNPPVKFNYLNNYYLIIKIKLVWFENILFYKNLLIHMK